MSTNTTTTNNKDSKESTTETSLLDDDLYERDSKDGLPEDITRDFNPNENVSLQTLELTPNELEQRLKENWEQYIGKVDNFPTAPQFSGEININILSLIASHYTPTIESSKVLFTTEGVFIRTVDPADIVMTTTWIDKDDFKEYNLKKEGKLALKWTKTTGDMINQVDKGDTVIIETGVKQKGENSPSNTKSSFDTPFELPNKLPKTFDKTPKRLNKKTNTNRRITFTIDDGIRMTTDDANPTPLKEEPDNFPFNRITETKLTGTELNNILTRISRFSDIVSLQKTENESVKIRGDGGNATVEKEYNSKDDIADTDSIPRFEFSCSGNGGVKSHYSVEYLVDFLKGVRKSNLKTPYTIKFDDDSPLLIKREIESNSFIKTQISHRVVE